MHAKQNFFKIGTKNALFVRFWAVIFERLSAYGTLALLNLSKCKALDKNKNPYIWD